MTTHASYGLSFFLSFFSLSLSLFLPFSTMYFFCSPLLRKLQNACQRKGLVVVAREEGALHNPNALCGTGSYRVVRLGLVGDLGSHGFLYFDN
jgi:hypothetical protein